MYILISNEPDHLNLFHGNVDCILFIQIIYNMSIIKVIEIMAHSKTSWEDAAQQAVHEASKTLKGIKSIYIKEHSATINHNNVIEDYRITANLSFEVESPDKAISHK